MTLGGVEITEQVRLPPVGIRQLQQPPGGFGTGPCIGVFLQKVRRPLAHIFIKILMAGGLAGIVAHAEKAVAESRPLPGLFRLLQILVISFFQILHENPPSFRKLPAEDLRAEISYARPTLPKSSILLATTFFMAAML